MIPFHTIHKRMPIMKITGVATVFPVTNLAAVGESNRLLLSAFIR